MEDYTSFLAKIGFDTEKSAEIEDYYGESLALGSLDVSLYQLVRAYMTLSDRGVYKELKIIKGEELQRREILDERAVYIIQNILSDREARSLTFDLENTLSTPFYSAVKTGTSKDMRDNWCVGFSEHYTVGVWTGNFSGEPMYNVSGSHGASQIWFALMNELHRKRNSKPPEQPGGIVKKKIIFKPPVEPSRDELFIVGTEPDRDEIVIEDGKIPRIIYPPDNSLFAFDPGLPTAQQKIYIYTNCTDCRVISDQREISGNSNIYLVDIIRGKHTIHLTDFSGRILDSVSYQVR
ncbi:MAG: hypothetical protein N3B13_10420 [Deltaproteobacteria bacterium]|nr:hypothetical protein [Deltaproteobacteria bacterium]